MSGILSLAEVGALIGEPVRTAMLVSLMDGRALTAGELARASGVTPQTASGHLARLVDGGLLTVSAQGRHRYFCLASPGVAQMIENMMGVAGVIQAARETRRISTGPADRALRTARRCYDHLAGEVAVGIAESMAASGYLELSLDAASVTASGAQFIAALGVDFEDGRSGHEFLIRAGAAICRPCMDWSERRPHLAGALGRALLASFLERKWMRQTKDSRAIIITPPGARALEQHFAIR